MKKILLFFAAMLVSFMSYAVDATFSLAYTATDTKTAAWNLTEGEITITFDKGTSTNTPSPNKEGSVRMYTGTTLSIAASTGYNITKVEFTPTTATYSATNLNYQGSAISDSWTLATPANSVVLTAAANARFKQIVVSYSSTSSTKTATTTSFPQSAYTAYIGTDFTAPTATVSGGTGLTATYSSSNTAVATVDATTGAVTLVAPGTTTIKATYAGDDTYESSSASYTLSVTGVYANLQALQAAITSTTAVPVKVTLSDVVVTGVKGSNAYINDGTYGAIIYTASHGLTEGATVNGTLEAMAQLYNGALEITNWSSTGLTITTGTLGTPAVKTASQLAVANVGMYVKVLNAAYNATAATFTDATGSLAYYDGLGKSVSLTDGKNYDVVGVYNYRNAGQLYPISVTEVAADVATPTFSVETGTYFEAQSVVLSQAAGKPIYYTLDGSDPTSSSTAQEYSEALNISATTTVKAAAKDGDNWSNVITKTYTINTVYANIKLAKAAITGTSSSDANTVSFTLTNAVVTYATGNHYYIQDATAGIYIYNSTDSLKTKLVAGSSLNGRMTATGYKYNGLYELTKDIIISDLTITTGATIPCTEVTIAELDANFADYESMRVKIAGTVTSKLSSQNATLTSGDNTMAIREKVSGNLSGSALDTLNSEVEVVGYPGLYNTTKQFNVWLKTDVTKVVPETPETIAAPVISPASCNFQTSIEVTITAEEGRLIFYSIDGTDPTSFANQYSTPLTLTATTTVKAVAVDENTGDFSEVVEATFTQSNDQVVTIGSFSALSGALNADLSYASYKGNASTDPFLSNNCIRLYQNGGYITISGVRGVKIHSVKVTSSDTYNSTTVGIAVDGGAAPTTGETLAKSSSYTFSGLDNNSVALYCLGTDKNTRLEIAALEVSYEKIEQTITALTLSGEYETSFSINGDFNHDGVVVTATYEDGETDVVTDNATFSTPDLSSLGEKTVTVSFGGASTTYTIQVIPAAVSSIAIAGEYQTIFALGDAFNHDGLIVTATYTDNTTANVTEDATFSTPDMSTTGVKTITITYGDKTANYTITVKAAAGSMAYELVDFTAISPYKDFTTNQTADMTTYSGASFDMVFSKGTNSNNGPKYYQNGDAVRAYAGNTLKITATDEIKRIDFLWVNGYVDDEVAITTSADTMVVTFSDKCRFTGVAVMYVNHTYAYYKATEDVAAGNENALLAQLNGIVASILTENDDVTYVITEDMTTGSQVRRQANMTVSADELTINVINPEIANEAQTAPEEGNRVIVYDGTTSATGVIGAKINSLDAKGWATSVENTAAEGIQKVMRDGKVIIIKNGVEYSVMGQKL